LSIVPRPPARQLAFLPPELEAVLGGLNPWWQPPHEVRPAPPAFRRRQTRALLERLRHRTPLIQVIRGPRQVGKTTAILQIAADLLAGGIAPTDLLLLRFDLQTLRETGGLLGLVRWYEANVRKRPLDEGGPAFLFLDEVHKLPRWSEEVKHLAETTRVRIVVTGSSSVLVAKGTRESLAGRVLTTELPTFPFREVLEAWQPELTPPVPPLRFLQTFDPGSLAVFEDLHAFAEGREGELGRALDRYYNRGGYPRLHSGEVDDDVWADYLVETVFDRVLGVDIPDLFPIQQPQLLRHLYLSVARRTGQEVSQLELATEANAAGLRTNQPTVGRYLHYLADALLIREFRRFPLAKAKTARVPVKTTLTDLGVRNAIFRGAPSLWESPPDVVGPLVETVVQTVIRDADLAVHFYRERIDPEDRRSPFQEVDFVAERTDGTVLPIEVKFRRKIDGADLAGLRNFVSRFRCPWGVVVTRDTWARLDDGILLVPLRDFLLAY
jgi:predicted AAA+ superfamily ATPase